MHPLSTLLLSLDYVDRVRLYSQELCVHDGPENLKKVYLEKLSCSLYSCFCALSVVEHLQT